MTLHLGDCLEVMRTLPDASVDAVVTDPPYGLSFMGKRWDYDVPSVEIWAECLRVLKPGGHLLAFAGTRTQHRMAVRIEDAGWRSPHHHHHRHLAPAHVRQRQISDRHRQATAEQSAVPRRWHCRSAPVRDAKAEPMR
jgi:tRNA G10  N-methylase Trm11